MVFGRRASRLFVSLASVALMTFVGYRLLPINATTQGFAYLLLVLIIASVWGFFEASLTSIAATLTFNFFFFEPVGKFTIDDPRNWVALFSFLVTSLIASRLSTEARRRALDAMAQEPARSQDEDAAGWRLWVVAKICIHEIGDCLDLHIGVMMLDHVDSGIVAVR